MKANLVTLGISLLVALALIEAGLRFADQSYPEFNRLDERLGWAPRAGVEGLYAMEGRVRLRINAAGFRDAEHALEKPAGSWRIAVLGDSMTEGREVTLAETFWKVMERRLASCLGPAGPVPEVLNFAVNGYGTAQQTIVLEHHAWAYAPDVVLLAFFVGNDVWNNARLLDGHEDRPFYVLEGGRLVLDDSNLRSSRFLAKKAWSDVKHGLYNTLRTVQVARQAYKRIKGWIKHSDAGAPLEAQLMAGLDPGVYRQPDGPPWDAAWAVTEALVRAMNQAVESRGAEFVLATLTAPVQAYPDPDFRRAFAAQLGVPDLAYPDRRMAELGAAEGFPVINLAPELQARADADGLLLHGSHGAVGGHWNRAGHRLAGETLARELCRAYGGLAR